MYCDFAYFIAIMHFVANYVKLYYVIYEQPLIESAIKEVVSVSEFLVVFQQPSSSFCNNSIQYIPYLRNSY